MFLKYIGNGNWIPGVPARDLMKQEAEKYSQDLEVNGKRGIDGLLASGLYERAHDEKPVKSQQVKEA